MSDAQERALERAAKRGDATALHALIRHRERRGDETLTRIRSAVVDAIHCRGVTEITLAPKTDSVGNLLIEVVLQHDMDTHDDSYVCAQSGGEYLDQVLSDLHGHGPHHGVAVSLKNGRLTSDVMTLDGVPVEIGITEISRTWAGWHTCRFNDITDDALEEEELEMLMNQAAEADGHVDFPPECHEDDPSECLIDNHEVM